MAGQLQDWPSMWPAVHFLATVSAFTLAEQSRQNSLHTQIVVISHRHMAGEQTRSIAHKTTTNLVQ